MQEDVTFEPKDRPLRADVGWLGKLLGQVLVELGDEGLFERVESARKLARRRRRGDEAAAARLTEELTALTPAESFEVVRAFSAYFGLVNMAERVHRIRRRVDRLKSGEAQPGGLRAVLAGLAREGVDADTVEEAISRVTVEPVLTAHPTEAVRRTLLRKEQRIARVLVDRFHGESMTPEELETAAERAALEIATGWQTEEQLHNKPTVGEEVEHVLFYLSEVVYRVVPALEDELRRAFLEAYGRPLFFDGPIVRFGSWVGGDMDGNPAVGAETIRATLGRQLQIVIQRYQREIEDLFGHLSQSRSRVQVSEGVDALIDDYQEMFALAYDKLPDRYSEMPYRLALQGIHARLGATAAEGDDAYLSPDDFLADLNLITASLDQNGGARAGLELVERLVARATTFGFHLAQLDCRQDAEVHRRVIGELLGIEGFSELPAQERIKKIASAIGDEEDSTEGGSDPTALTEEAQATLAVFEELRGARSRHGERSVGTFVISMAQDADDALAILLLARVAGCVDSEGLVPLDVVPLFETVDDLERGPDVLTRLANSKHYAEHLATRDGKQLVMLGYSDSNKDGGIAASRWALHRGQEKMVASAPDGMELSFFHGRGGSTSRGGAKPRAAILAAPAGAVAGRARMTEQGEVIHDKYGLRGIALRTLELLVGATIERCATGDRPRTEAPAPQASLSEVPAETASAASTLILGAGSQPAIEPAPAWREVMEVLSAASRAKYRSLVHDDPDFPELFRSMTPIDVIERLRIGSRPAKRRAMRGVGDLRAIPWVFAWTQARVILPGWFGVGTGLQAIRDRGDGDVLTEMAQSWPFFDTFLSNVEMVLAKADLEIAARYALLAGDVGRRLFPVIVEEFDRTKAAVLAIRGEAEILDRDPVLQRSIRLRNPYVDPMSFLQVELLPTWRATDREDVELERVLIETVRGIARGLRNTG